MGLCCEFGCALAATGLTVLPIQDSGEAQAAVGDPLFTGQVVSESGAAVPGAEVTISIWPSEEDLVSMSESEVVSTGIIGTTMSSSTGPYSAAATQTSQFPAISGIYDATVFVAGEGDAFAVHETSLRYDAGTLTFSPISELQGVTQLETEIVIEPAPGKDEGTDPVDPTGTGASAMFATEGGTAGEFPGTSEVVSETGSTQGVTLPLTPSTSPMGVRRGPPACVAGPRSPSDTPGFLST